MKELDKSIFFKDRVQPESPHFNQLRQIARQVFLVFHKYFKHSQKFKVLPVKILPLRVNYPLIQYFTTKNLYANQVKLVFCLRS